MGLKKILSYLFLSKKLEILVKAKIEEQKKEPNN